MSVPVDALKVGKCYLTNTGRVWRIIQHMSDGRILYERRPGHVQAKKWQAGMMAGQLVEALIEREVPCDWTPEMDG